MENTTATSASSSPSTRSPEERFEDRIVELMSMEDDWDAGLFCHTDEEGRHVQNEGSGPVQPSTIRRLRDLIRTAEIYPDEIMPISSAGQDGPWLMLDWHGKRDTFSLELSPYDGACGWILIVDHESESCRSFESDVAIDPAEIRRFVRTVKNITM